MCFGLSEINLGFSTEERTMTMEQEYELLDCPFCGGKAETDYAYFDSNNPGVHCTVCNAYVCDCFSLENAVKKWNSRVQGGNP